MFKAHRLKTKTREKRKISTHSCTSPLCTRHLDTLASYSQAPTGCPMRKPKVIKCSEIIESTGHANVKRASSRNINTQETEIVTGLLRLSSKDLTCLNNLKTFK